MLIFSTARSASYVSDKKTDIEYHEANSLAEMITLVVIQDFSASVGCRLLSPK